MTQKRGVNVMQELEAYVVALSSDTAAANRCPVQVKCDTEPQRVFCGEAPFSNASNRLCRYVFFSHNLMYKSCLLFNSYFRTYCNEWQSGSDNQRLQTTI